LDFGDVPLILQTNSQGGWLIIPLFHIFPHYFQFHQVFFFPHFFGSWQTVTVLQLPKLREELRDLEEQREQRRPEVEMQSAELGLGGSRNL
jgi:hypothetical protein